MILIKRVALNLATAALLVAAVAALVVASLWNDRYLAESGRLRDFPEFPIPTPAKGGQWADGHRVRAKANGHFELLPGEVRGLSVEDYMRASGIEPESVMDSPEYSGSDWRRFHPKETQ